MSSAYSDANADVLTIVTIPVMVSVNKVTLKINPCSTTFLEDNMETKHCQHEHRSNDPGGSLKEKWQPISGIRQMEGLVSPHGVIHLLHAGAEL
jgi:hypothetical protein